MRILHVVPSYIPAWRYGGPIHSVHGLCKALAARGNQVDVATTNVDGEGDSDVPLEVPVDLDGVKVHYFPSNRLRRLYYSPPMRAFMQANMSRWDVVHLHSVFLWPTTAAARIARKHRKPYILSPRGMLVRDLIERKSSWLKRGWIQFFERKNVRCAAAIHVTSSVEDNELRAMGLQPRRVFDIPNGFDLPACEGLGRVETVRGVPQQYALFLGRISWKKGLDRLIEATALVPGLHVVIAGNDDEDYWPEITKRVEALKIADRIHYVGFVEGAAKVRLLAQALFLALPSYSENFGNVVLEAMALGIAVVVTPEVGLSTVVAESRSGLVCGGEPAELSAALRSLASDEPLRTTLGRNGSAAAAAYSWDSVARRMEVEYATLVGGHG